MDLLSDRGLAERLLREEAERLERDAVVLRVEELLREATELPWLSDDGVGEGFAKLLAEFLWDDVSGGEACSCGLVAWSEGSVLAPGSVGAVVKEFAFGSNEFGVDGLVRQASSAKTRPGGWPGLCVYDEHSSGGRRAPLLRLSDYLQRLRCPPGDDEFRREDDTATLEAATSAYDGGGAMLHAARHHRQPS